MERVPGESIVAAKADFRFVGTFARLRLNRRPTFGARLCDAAVLSAIWALAEPCPRLETKEAF